jgi:hypothetical protein
MRHDRDFEWFPCEWLKAPYPPARKNEHFDSTQVVLKFDRYNIVSEQDLTDAVRKLQKFQDAAEPACQPAHAESSTPADRPEFVN